MPPSSGYMCLKVEVEDVCYHLASLCLIYDILHTLWQHTKMQDIFIAMLKCACGCKKVKWSRYRPGVAQRVGRGIALLFHYRGTRRGWVVSSTPRPHFTPGNDQVPILQEAGCAPGPVWKGRKSRPTGFRSRTVQPVVSQYTDWATRCLWLFCLNSNFVQLLRSISTWQLRKLAEK